MRIAVRAMLLAAFCACTANAQNIVTNAGFDQNLSGWTEIFTNSHVQTAWIGDDASASAASGSAKETFVANTACGSACISTGLSHFFPLTSGRTFEFGGRVKILGQPQAPAGYPPAGVAIDWFTDDYSYLGGTALNGAAQRQVGVWMPTGNVTVTIPSGAKRAAIRLWVETTNGFSAAFDDVYVRPASRLLTVAKSGSGFGTVTSNPQGISCGDTCSAGFASGTVVSLTAAVASGSTLAAWSGDCSGTGACVVTMDQARWVGARFEAARLAITSFTATPPTIPRGGSSTLSWTTTGAASVTLDNALGSQAINGSVTVHPTSTTTYTLTATNGGASVSAAVTVVVQPSTVSGNPQHFEFVVLIAQQSEGVPFPVTLVAQDATGTTVDFTGEVTLHSELADVDPTVLRLVDGMVTTNVSVLGPGRGIRLLADGSGAHGESNPFDVAGADMTGRLSGRVDRYAGGGNAVPVQTGTVTLKGAGATFVATINKGRYEFSVPLPCGAYVAHAGDGVLVSEQTATTVPCSGTSATHDFTLTPSCKPSNLTPVLLVPGMMGSTTGAGYPTLPAWQPGWEDSQWPQSGGAVGGIWDSLNTLPGTHLGWADLVGELETRGYQWNCTIFPVPYDWRLPPQAIVRSYLLNRIDQAKQRAGCTSQQCKVDIVAHSMGGIVARAYIQSSIYRADIRRLAIVGTPNQGSAKAYYLWSGGDPIAADKLDDGGSVKLWLAPYHRVSEDQWEVIYNAAFPSDYDDDPAGYRDVMRRFYQSRIPSIQVLMPTGVVLTRVDGDSAAVDANPILSALNSSGSQRFVGAGDGVVTKLFAGTGQETVDKIRVGRRDSNRFLYTDGVPIAVATYSDGDGTVLQSSLANGDYWRLGTPPVTMAAKHAELVGVFRKDIATFLAGPAATSTPGFARSTDTLESAGSYIDVVVTGGPQPYLTNAAGKSAGVSPQGGAADDTLPGSLVSLSSRKSSVAVTPAPDGTYILTLHGGREGEFRLRLGIVAKKTDDEIATSGYYRGKPFTATVTVDAESAQPLRLTHSPAAPMNLVASPEGLGEPVTVLSWQSGGGKDVAGYIVYSRATNQPRLTEIGRTTTSTFRTSTAWASATSAGVILYAVAAVGSDGTESWLTPYVRNDDRDHDGISDVEEGLRHTNPASADSDDDGLSDGDEVSRGTNPLAMDSDGDGVNDWTEVHGKSDPLEPASKPDPHSGSSRRRSVQPPSSGTVLRTLAVVVSGNGSVSSKPSGIQCPPSCFAAFPKGQVVTLDPLPASGATLSAWSGACSGKADCKVNLEEATSVTATFAPADTNGVLNGDFASDLKWWRWDDRYEQGGGSAAWDSRDAKSRAGSGSMRLTSTAMARAFQQVQCVPLAPSKSYTYGVSLRQVDAGNAYLGVLEYASNDCTGTHVRFEFEQITATADMWRSAERTLVASPSVRSAYLLLGSGLAAGSSHEVWFDDAFLRVAP